MKIEYSRKVQKYLDNQGKISVLKEEVYEVFGNKYRLISDGSYLYFHRPLFLGARAYLGVMYDLNDNRLVCRLQNLSLAKKIARPLNWDVYVYDI